MSNQQLAKWLIIIVLLMLAMCAASIPLYSIFCKATGFIGTTKIATTAPTSKGERLIKVQFDSNLDPELLWNFYPKQREISIKPGDTMLVYFYAENISTENIIGTAVFNVTPYKAGQYFNKIKCFCFEEQLLKPNEHMTMPVLFYLDPNLENDREADDISLITLSYTFFKVRTINLD